MDVRVIGGVALICVIIAVVGVVYYNYDFNTQGVNETTINTGNTTNNDTTNTSQSNNQLELTVLPDNQPGPNLAHRQVLALLPIQWIVLSAFSMLI